MMVEEAVSIPTIKSVDKMNMLSVRRANNMSHKMCNIPEINNN